MLQVISMLEKMETSFEKRLSDYDEHMLTTIEGATEFYYYDTPLAVSHEIAILKRSGFSDVRTLKNWVATYTLLVKR